MKSLATPRQIAGAALVRRTVVAGVVVLAVGFGCTGSPLWLVVLGASAAAVALLQRPIWGLFALVPAALVVPLQISTGSEVAVNSVTLLVPTVFLLWVLDMMRQGKVHLVPSATNKPLILFLATGLLSLVIGIGTWDPAVPRPGSFTIVQVAQWAIFAFSAMAYWLMGNLVWDQTWLRRIVFLFLGLAGCLAILFVIPGLGPQVYRRTTEVLNRAPFWMLLSALALGQLLFNNHLSTRWRFFLVLVLAAVVVFVLYWNRDSVSTWIGIAAVVSVLGWLRWPRLRWPIIFLLLMMLVSGILTSAIYDFAGGAEVWESSGGSRLALIGRVVKVTMRNPITGLGPAAYRAYGAMEPLPYGRALWIQPRISSHNNYVDLFSHVGVLGLAIFFWFAVEIAKMGLRLRHHFSQGFALAYVNSMMAAGTGALVLMLFADWILPFVYNIGFPGFQASVLVWLFLGGMLVFEQLSRERRDISHTE